MAARPWAISRWQQAAAAFAVHAAATADLKAQEPLPHGFHNLFVILVMGTVLLWIMKVAWQLFRAADLNARLANHQSLQLEGMSIYANDFQMLIRQHFNQILRIRRTVPPKKVARHSLSIHVHPDSLTVYSGEDADRAQGAFGVQFTVDAMTPCSVKLFWGVSVAACNEFGRLHAGTSSADGGAGRNWGGAATAEAGAGRRRRSRQGATTAQESTRSLLEMEELGGSAVGGVAGGVGGKESQSLFLPGQYMAQSRDFFLPAGQGQRYATPAGDLMDQSQLTFDLGAPWLRDGQVVDDSAVMPLAIVTIAQRRPSRELAEVQGVPVVEAHGEVSFVKFRQTNGPRGFGPGIPEIVRQFSFGERAVHEIQGIFGFEEDEGDGECMICYSRPKNVLLLPCRHCSVCHPCLRSLRDEKCPLCRSVFSSYVTFTNQRYGGGASPQAADSTQPPGEDPEPPPGGDSGGGGPSGDRGGSGGGASGDADAGAGGGSGAGASTIAGASGAGCGASTGGSSEVSGGGGSEPPASGEGATGAPTMQVSNASARQVVITPAPSGGEALRPAGPLRSGARSGSRGAAAMAPLEGRSVTPREAPSARPRGTALAQRTMEQGRRLSGRARFSERADAASEPLLDGGATRSTGVEEASRSLLAETDDCRREQASAMQTEGPTEETCILADAV